jgi:hypothetical protein
MFLFGLLVGMGIGFVLGVAVAGAWAWFALRNLNDCPTCGKNWDEHPAMSSGRESQRREPPASDLPNLPAHPA